MKFRLKGKPPKAPQKINAYNFNIPKASVLYRAFWQA